jgi:hypothetical protein
LFIYLFILLLFLSQAGRGLAGPSPGGVGAQGEFVKYEPSGGAYALRRGSGSGGGDASFDFMASGDAFEGLGGDPFGCCVVARVGFGGTHEGLVSAAVARGWLDAAF